MTLLFTIFAFIFGLIVGSFLNCLAWRLHQEESILGRSYCPNCRQQIAWYDNIPILSFILLRGRCRHCQQTISWQYPLIELLTALLFAISFFINSTALNLPLLLARDYLLIAGLILVFIYDFRWQLVPMTIVWPLIILIFILNLLLGFLWLDIILLGLAGALFFLLQFLITKGRGLGEGDIWLGLLLGITFPNFKLLILCLVLSYFIGAIFSFFLILSHQKKLKSKIALGPFLAFGAIITLIYGEKIISWYLGIV